MPVSLLPSTTFSTTPLLPLHYYYTTSTLRTALRGGALLPPSPLLLRPSAAIPHRRHRGTTSGNGGGGSAPRNGGPHSKPPHSELATEKKLTMSLDGTWTIPDDLARKRLEKRKSYYESASAKVEGMGGNMIRAPWDHPETNGSSSSSSSSGGGNNPSSTTFTSPFLKFPRTVGLLGAPFCFGQPLSGTDLGPSLLRDMGLKKALTSIGWRVNDYRDLILEPPTKAELEADLAFYAKTGALAHNASAVGRLAQQLGEAVEEIARKQEFALTIGGDHSIATGTLTGILKARPDTAVIWVDAHADLNTPFTSETGNMHGMPLGIIMGDKELRNSIPGFGWMSPEHGGGVPVLRPQKLVYIGVRDLDQAEKREIRRRNILTFTMHEVDKYGIGGVMERTLAHIGSDCPIHLSYDIDAVDPEIAPATGTIVRGGFNYREANYICEALAETNRLASMDLVEINPSLSAAPRDNTTIALGLSLVASALGQRIL